MFMKRPETEIVVVLEFEENEARPEVPPEQEKVSATEEEENRLSDNRTNTDTENGSSSEEEPRGSGRFICRFVNF